MAYVVQSTEKIRGVGAEYETKAMLYLMSCREDSSQIYYFAIDFFNDVTGMTNFVDKAWDLQSKGAKNNSPKAIGKELVTLLKNYMSDLKFDFLILFLGGVTSSFRIDDKLTTFGIENVKETAIKKVKEGIIEEGTDKEYIDSSWLSGENLDKFLNEVTFVIDDKSKAEYIKRIIAVNPKYIPKDEVLDGIFNTIRDAQAAKKNNSSVEGEVIQRMDEVLYYDRTLKAKDIRLMVVNVFINGDLMNKNIPAYFFPVIQRYDVIKQKDVVEDCRLKLSTVLFDKANTDGFWDLLDVIAEAVVGNRNLSTIETYNLIKDNEAVHNPKMDILTVQYLISVMKEALE